MPKKCSRKTSKCKKTARRKRIPSFRLPPYIFQPDIEVEDEFVTRIRPRRRRNALVPPIVFLDEFAKVPRKRRNALLPPIVNDVEDEFEDEFLDAIDQEPGRRRDAILPPIVSQFMDKVENTLVSLRQPVDDVEDEFDKEAQDELEDEFEHDEFDGESTTAQEPEGDSILPPIVSQLVDKVVSLTQPDVEDEFDKEAQDELEDEFEDDEFDGESTTAQEPGGDSILPPIVSQLVDKVVSLTQPESATVDKVEVEDVFEDAVKNDDESDLDDKFEDASDGEDENEVVVDKAPKRVINPFTAEELNKMGCVGEGGLVVLSRRCPLSVSSAEYPFTYRGDTYFSVEQFVFAEKAKALKDTEMRKKIMALPKFMIHTSTSFKSLLKREFRANGAGEKRWAQIQRQTLYLGNCLKFSEAGNNKAAEFLVKTGDKGLKTSMMTLSDFLGYDEILLKIRNSLRENASMDRAACGRA